MSGCLHAWNLFPPCGNARLLILFSVMSAGGWRSWEVYPVFNLSKPLRKAYRPTCWFFLLGNSVL